MKKCTGKSNFIKLSMEIEVHNFDDLVNIFNLASKYTKQFTKLA